MFTNSSIRVNPRLFFIFSSFLCVFWKIFFFRTALKTSDFSRSPLRTVTIILKISGDDNERRETFTVFCRILQILQLTRKKNDYFRFSWKISVIAKKKFSITAGRQGEYFKIFPFKKRFFVPAGAEAKKTQSVKELSILL